MEKPLYKFRNNFRNTIVIIYWILIIVGSSFTAIYFNLINGFISLIIYSIILMILLFPKRLIISKYHDALVFNERSFHPNQNKDFGVMYENIKDFNLNSTIVQPVFDRIFGHNKVILSKIFIRKKDGKEIKRIISLNAQDKLELEKTLNKNVTKMMHSLD